MLRDFSAAERKELPFLVADAADAVEQLVAEGLLAPSSGGTVPPSERHFRAFFHAEWVFILVAQNR